MDKGSWRESVIFSRMEKDEIEKALRFLQARECEFAKGELLLCAGEPTKAMGLVLEGSVAVESNDVWGNRMLLYIVEAGGLFGESYALLNDEPMLVDVRASGDCRVLFLKVGRLIYPEGHRQSGEGTDTWMLKLLRNLLRVTSNKNLHLSARSFHTAPKTVRGRIMAYFSMLSLQKHAKEFETPFNRQQMADYLNLDRSALSRELGKMRDEGIIWFYKNHFIVRLFESQD